MKVIDERKLKEKFIVGTEKDFYRNIKKYDESMIPVKQEVILVFVQLKGLLRLHLVSSASVGGNGNVDQSGIHRLMNGWG